jgi:hypothetical protein
MSTSRRSSPRSAPRRSVAYASLRRGHKEAVAEGGHELPVALASGQDGGDDPSARAAKDFDDLAHLQAHVRAQRAGIGEVQLPRGVAGEGIRNQRCLVRPPAVNRGFADVGVGRHIFNRQIGKTSLPQEFQGAVHDGLPRLLTARAPRSALATARATFAVAHSRLTHDPHPTIYNRSLA